MSPIQHSCSTKVLFLLYLFLFLFIFSTFISAIQIPPKPSSSSRRLLLDLEDEQPIIKKKTNSTKISNKNTTKLIKPTSISSSKNQTKLVKTTNSGSLKSNQTKLIDKTLFNSSKTNKTKTSLNTSNLKSQSKKLNSTSNPKPSSNSTLLTKKSSDLTKSTKPTKETNSKSQMGNKPKSKSPDKAQIKPTWIDHEDEDEDDLVADFRDLPSKFQETFMPDLERFSKSSRVYLTKYNNEFTKGFKPYVGNKYASTIASLVSFAFIIIPLILVSLIFNKIKAYFSLQKLLIFIQVYLAIYFTILCLSSLATGLEPLRFFYSTSQSTYMCVQVFQTLAYVLYLLLLLMYLILVFSTETGLATKILGLAQTFVGFAVGLHYYMTVFHRAVLHQQPKTSWKVHGLYATCFLVICLLGRVDRRKKAYLVEGVEEGKKS